ncbi:cytochrome P450 [Lichenifustis flavocetrariae]|uniref:Cytochrome P450 n=1 Tax=Lichenifustis flavocetrariae TaxID=2949735 RepID=A0AA42CPY3_9HYPH|nr:cytochrome P450 [Lichenifustis flavocetrariae]MCW6510895.1 cytochrome P450 [Lichenifustis flavocetrariae]
MTSLDAAGPSRFAVTPEPGLSPHHFEAPGPPPVDRPLGTLALLKELRRNPVATWTRLHYDRLLLSGESILGKIVVVSDPALIRHILVDNVANYPKDRLQQRVLSSGLGRGLLLAEGDNWRMQRRALAPLFTPRTVMSFQVAMADVASELVERWDRQRDGRRLDASREMARATLHVLARTIFSDGLGRRTEDFIAAVTRYLEAMGKLDPLDILDMPAWIPRVGRLKARSTLQFFDGVVTTMIEERRSLIQKSPEAAPRDLLTLLLEAADPESGEGLSEDDIKANIVTFIAAGHETTSNTLTWALYLVSQDPHARARLEAEVDRELPDGRFVPGSIDALPYTRAVIDEALRLYPPAATLTRDAIGPDMLGTLRVKAGGRIVISPWVLHRHNKLWPSPGVFDPNRFLEPNKQSIDRFAYLPFGAGPRVCIGASFAIQEAVIILATVVRRYRLDLCAGHVVMPLQRVSLRPQGGMPMLASQRNRDQRTL